GGFAGVEVRLDLVEHMAFRGGVFVAALHVLADFVATTAQGVEIGQDQFGRYDLDVPDRVHAAGDVRDVRVFKTAHDLHEGVHFADVAEEFVSQPFPLRCAFHQSGNVHELDGCRDDFVRFGDFGQRSQTRIRHFDDADI